MAARALSGVARVGRGFATYKSSTGLVGLAVDRNGRDTLLEVSAQVLKAVKVCDLCLPCFDRGFGMVLLLTLLQTPISRPPPLFTNPPRPFRQKIPATSPYRADVEKWCNFFTKVASTTNDIKAIEGEIALGQIEEVIEMVKDELKLVDIYYESKGWEQVADEAKRADSMIAQMADSVYFSAPPPTVPPPVAPK